MDRVGTLTSKVRHRPRFDAGDGMAASEAREVGYSQAAETGGEG
jgi:hypothetical protein